MLFFIHIILFLLLRSYKANLFFAFFCLGWFLKTGFTGAKLLTDIAPWIPWAIKFRIGYLVVLLTVSFLIYLTAETFPGVLQKWFRRAIYVWSLLISIFCLTVDTVLLSQSMSYCQAFYMVAFVYILVRFAFKQRSLNPEQGVFLFGIVLFLGVMIYDIYLSFLRYLGYATDPSNLAMLLLALCEAATMFIVTVKKIEDARAEEQRLVLENMALDRVNRMRGSMMATMGHEMRTPLTVMSIYAQLATENLQELSADEQTTADLKMISREAKRLADMATGLLTINREQEQKGRFEKLDLAALVEQMAGLCRSMLNKNNNCLVLNLDDNLPNIQANIGECTQLLWNILSNCARHTKDGTVTIGAVQEQDTVVMTITDNGDGINPRLLPNIFERGFSGSVERSGLGLSICKEIIDAHGGNITIAPAKMGGTIVTVTLPIEQKEGSHG